MVTVYPIETIISDTTIRDGQPIIAGTQIRVIDVVASHLYRGHTAEQLALNFNLRLGQIYAVLAYYYQHKADVDKLLQSEADKAQIYLDKLAEDGKLIRVQ